MNLIQSENIKPFDVDGTLVYKPGTLPDKEPLEHSMITIMDPISSTGGTITMAVNLNMVRLLKEEKHRGACVVVWSRGGYAWANAVVTALGLKESVDFCMSKPLAYFDDVPCQEWLQNQVFIDPKIQYKR